MNNRPVQISVVVAVYNASETLGILINSLSETIPSFEQYYEVILVDDGSEDDSWQIIQKHSGLDYQIKGIKLSRNFGQHNAISAGLRFSQGEYVVVMDCDMQDSPTDIEALYEKIKQGYEIVYTLREQRFHSRFRNIGSFIFNYIFNLLLDSKAQSSSYNIGTFSIITRKVVNAFLSVNDHNRHYLIILRWLGFRSDIIKIDHHPRLAGQSTYTVSKLIRHAINGIVSQSNKLLTLSIFAGLLFCCASFLGIIGLLFLYFSHGFKEGWTSVIILLLFSTGLLMMSLGIVGLYIGKVFDQVKNRPLFFVDRVLNISDSIYNEKKD